MASEPIPTRSPMARWGQIAYDLRRQIEGGAIRGGDKLPSENELAANYGVSRITVRQALSHLAGEGLLLRRQGAGTFAAHNREVVQHDLAIAEPWRNRLRAAGIPARSKQLSPVLEPAPITLIADLGIAEDAVGAWCLRRVQIVHDQPIGYTESWLAPGVAPGIEREPLMEASLSLTLNERYGIAVETAHSYLHAEVASAEVAIALECAVETPVFVVHTANLDAAGELLEISRTYWIASRVRFHHTHTRPAPTVAQ